MRWGKIHCIQKGLFTRPVCHNPWTTLWLFTVPVQTGWSHVGGGLHANISPQHELDAARSVKSRSRIVPYTVGIMVTHLMSFCKHYFPSRLTSWHLGRAIVRSTVRHMWWPATGRWRAADWGRPIVLWRLIVALTGWRWTVTKQKRIKRINRQYQNISW